MDDRVDKPREETSARRLLLAVPAFRNAAYGATRSTAIVGQVAAVIMAAAALGLRFILDPMLPPGFPYLTFFPAVVLTGFIWGITPAVTAGILSGLASWYWFIEPSGSFALDPRATTALVFYIFVIATDIGLLFLALKALGAQVRASEALAEALQLQQVVSKEVDHRLKNLMATVSSLISLMEKHASTPAELASQLRQRINALSGSIGLLRGAVGDERVSMRKAILAALEPLGLADPRRTTLNGPDVTISSNGLIPLNLILHELATNALKHGAFSNQSGVIKLDWDVTPSAGGKAVLNLIWTERAGPSTAVPTRSGFGTELLKRISRSLGGGCELSYDPAGLTAKISFEPMSILDSY